MGIHFQAGKTPTKGNMHKLVKWYQDWELRNFPRVTRWWRGLVPPVRWAFRIIAVVLVVEAFRL